MHKASVIVTRDRLIVAGQPLSTRQRIVLQAIADGGSNSHVAHELGVSEETIKTHVKLLMHKLRAENRAHAVAIAFRKGLLA